MKKLMITGIAFSLTMFSCKKAETTASQNSQTDSTQSAYKDSTTAVSSSTSTDFNPSILPESKAELGEFPYFTLPSWIDDSSNYGGDRNTDFGKLVVYTGKSFHTVEGPVFSKSYNMKDEGKSKSQSWDEYKFATSFSKHFESLGAKKIWEGKIPNEAIKKLNDENNRDDYYYTFGTPNQKNLIVYGLQQQGKEIFFIIATNSSYGSITVGQNGELKQEIGIIKSDQIQKDLAENGKSVLHINFDIDKATLKPDGQLAIAEIATVLNHDKNLKLDINGYTDNSGNDAHNLQLSKDRAKTVETVLVISGIDKNRLNANGFGSANPISSNNTEDGKAQNRRVELVKK